jgi:hypothetical protein
MYSQKKNVPPLLQKQKGSVAVNYSWLIAPTGQFAAHAPHSTHSSAVIWYLPSPSSFGAPTGQVLAQVPQPTQASVSILKAMLEHLLSPLHNSTQQHFMVSQLLLSDNIFFHTAILYTFMPVSGRNTYHMKIPAVSPNQLYSFR